MSETCRECKELVVAGKNYCKYHLFYRRIIRKIDSSMIRKLFDYYVDDLKEVCAGTGAVIPVSDINAKLRSPELDKTNVENYVFYPARASVTYGNKKELAKLLEQLNDKVKELQEGLELASKVMRNLANKEE